MPTMRVDAHELSKVKVEWVSLVHRPANRLPIRILKGDTAVLDLDHHHRKVDAARAVKAEAVSKASQAISDATLLLVQAGYKVIPAAGGPDDTRSDDGAAIDADPVTADTGKNPAANSTDDNRQDDGSPNAFAPDTPELSIAVTGKMKNTSGVSDGATPGDGLCQEIPYSTVTKGDKKPMAKSKMKKPAAVAAPCPPESMQVEKGGTAPDEEADNPDDDEDPENPATDDDDQETMDDNEKAVAKPGVAKSKTKKSDDDALATILASMQAMSANVTALSTNIRKMDEKVSGIETQLNGVSARVAKTDKSLAVLVTGQAPADHEVPVTKSDTKIYPLIDTAYKHRL